MILIILGAVLIALGLFMVICPKQAAKKENRDNPEAVSKVRKSGIIEVVCGILLIIIEIIM